RADNGSSSKSSSKLPLYLGVSRMTRSAAILCCVEHERVGGVAADERQRLHLELAAGGALDVLGQRDGAPELRVGCADRGRAVGPPDKVEGRTVAVQRPEDLVRLARRAAHHHVEGDLVDALTTQEL